MKNKLFGLAVIALIFANGCKEAPQGNDVKTAEAREVSMGSGANVFEIDTAASNLEWIAAKLTTYHHGEVQIKSGELDIKDGKISAGNFVIDMSTIIARDKGKEDVNDRLTGHLKSPDFFDAAKYPEATFEITGVKKFDGTVTADGSAEEISEYTVSDPNYLISGNLRIKDVTKNIEFPAKVTIDENKIDAVAKFSIDRKMWNITYPGAPDNLIQDMIWFGVSIHADKGSGKKELNY